MGRLDLPTVDQETQGFWEGLEQDELRLQRCGGCGHAQVNSRPFCARCWSEDLTWEVASGRGTLYTYSVVHLNTLPPFDERVPYIAALVDLDEGPRIMTNVVGVEGDEIEIGMSLEVEFASDPELTRPVFRPAVGSDPRPRGSDSR